VIQDLSDIRQHDEDKPTPDGQLPEGNQERADDYENPINDHTPKRARWVWNRIGR
jgi:hypothetical protein